jgi:hypothetical protein
MTQPVAQPQPPTSPPAREVRYRCSEQFLPILRHLDASLLVSTYQAGKVATIAAKGVAFVGMSKIRETATFGVLPIGERSEKLRCGVAVVQRRLV